MTSTTEWLQEFNLMYNNIMSNKAPGLDPYEISVLLTRAQKQLITDLFGARSNAMLVGFDGSPIRQADFSTLVRVESMIPATVDVPFDNRSTTKFFSYPDGVYIVLNEMVEDGSRRYVVVPISYEEYSRLMTLPYKYPAKGQAWRFIDGNKDGKTNVELIARFDGEVDYRVHYVREPKPIILVNLEPRELSIDGETKPMVSELPEHLHMEIINRAVALAKVAWMDTVSPKQQ